MARATYYYHTKRLQEPNRNEDIRQSISRIYDTHKGRYGYRRVTAQLRSDGIIINHKKVQNLMVEMGLRGKRKKTRYRSYKGEIGKI
jgi:transposase InsO family protein